jgi:C1A family cysteine protease
MPLSKIAPTSRKLRAVLRPVTNHQWYGWKPDKKDDRDHVLTVPVPGKLPERVYLQGGMPPIYDQGALGSCTANAIAAAIQYDRINQGLPNWMPSRLFVYANERIMEGVSLSEDSGAEIRDGIKSINSLGDCPEAEWPYDATDDSPGTRYAVKPTAACYAHAAQHIALRYQRVVQSEQSILAVLAAGLPIVFGFTVYESFESAAVANSGIVPMPAAGEKVVGGHAVCAVGYSQVTKRFSVRNSWSRNWGLNGNCLMPFAYLLDPNLSSDFWVVQQVE